MIALTLSVLFLMPSLAVADEAQTPADKDETVYMYTDATGVIKNAEVSVLLKNDSAAKKLRDSSNLSDIKGKDDVSFTGSGNSLVWNADGKDVSYTGTTAAQMPVTLKATYTLDGKTVTPEQLAGKSGRVTIRYEFANHSSTTADINGSCETVYTPFTCISAIMLDGNDFKNVSVENCKIINDGNDMIVAGYAMPGLKESLGSMGENADIPDFFSVSADVTGFELKSTMTVVTAGIMSEIDSDSLGIGFDGDASALSDAMAQIISSSDTLSSSLGVLAEKLKELESGTEGIKDGTKALSNGLDELAGDDGLPALADGMKSLESGTAGIVAGLQAVGSGLNDLAGQEGLRALEGHEHALSDAISHIGEEAATMKEALASAATSLAEAAQYQPAFDGALSIMQDEAKMQKMIESGALSPDEYESIVTALAIGSELTGSVSDVSTQLEGAAEEVSSLEKGIEDLTANAELIAGGIGDAATAAGELANGAKQLEEAASQLQAATPQLVQGAESAADAADQLASGAKDLEGYAEQLNEAAPALTEGAQTAADGSKTLTDGMRAFNDEGINQLVDSIQGEFGGISDRVNALSDASRSYTNFSGITPGTSGSVKFVIETDPIKKA